MNKRLLSFLLPALLLTAVYSSCKKADDKAPALAPTDEYFPLQKGKYIIYDVDSTYWDSYYCVIRTYKNQVMYTVADTFTDGQNRFSYRIETRFRKKVEDAWIPQEVIYATNTGTVLEVAHNTFRWIKLQFPVTNGFKWKGNALISAEDKVNNYLNDWDYEYVDVNANFNAGKVIYKNTVSVLERDETVNNPETIPGQFASRTYSKEVYASGIGMVYREYYHWTYDASAPNNKDINNPVRCMEGTGVIMRAVDHN